MNALLRTTARAHIHRASPRSMNASRPIGLASIQSSEITKRQSSSNSSGGRGDVSSSPAGNKHNTDTYAKEVDTTPVEDKSVHRVDPDSENVQKPHEPPSGDFSRAGTQTDEYRHVEGSDQPYAPKNGDKGRYGTRDSWAEEKGPETAHSGEGPEGKSSGGRK
ncbi:hypothetical protein CPC08DRAFT_716930 [Agrocybe pediades]|nr:hypothetical protein CPC08DRAFT_716930 [Agrocybe pediades]